MTIEKAREHAAKALDELVDVKPFDDLPEIRSYLRLAGELMTESPPCQMFAGIDPAAGRFFTDGSEGGKDEVPTSDDGKED